MKKSIVLFLCLSLLVYGCKKKCYDRTDIYCENYDPCYTDSLVKADFLYYENGMADLPDTWVYNVDTLLGNIVQFKAKENRPGTTYKWLLGSETITDRSFYRTDFPRGTTVPVTLIVNAPPHKCYPNDDGIDTLTKSMYFLPQDSKAAYEDRQMTVYNEKSPTNEFQILLKSNKMGNGADTLFNFPEQGCSTHLQEFPNPAAYYAAYYKNWHWIVSNGNPNYPTGWYVSQILIIINPDRTGFIRFYNDKTKAYEKLIIKN